MGYFPLKRALPVIIIATMITTIATFTGRLRGATSVVQNHI